MFHLFIGNHLTSYWSIFGPRHHANRWVQMHLNNEFFCWPSAIKKWIRSPNYLAILGMVWNQLFYSLIGGTEWCYFYGFLNRLFWFVCSRDLNVKSYVRHSKLCANLEIDFFMIASNLLVYFRFFYFRFGKHGLLSRVKNVQNLQEICV